MSTPLRFRSEWLRGYHDRPAARLRLVCFPHAGGSATFYRPWHEGLSPHTELYAVQYPGRGDRMRAPLVDDARTMARLIVDDLGPLLDRPVALFGHSMGAFVAHEAARLLERRRAPLVRLFVSGQIAPPAPAGGRAGPPDALHPVSRVADADDEAVIRHLDRLGGTEGELLSDPALREVFLPSIRNDFRLVGSYRGIAGPLLSVPVTALAGADDPVASPAAAERWRATTSSGFALEVFPGGHFFLQAEQERVLKVVNDTLSAMG